MRCLVTGANGFLGGRIMRLLLRRGQEAVPLTRAMLDISNPTALVSTLRAANPEVVVNCAATVRFELGCMAEIYATNSLAPAVIADWARGSGAYLVQCSSIAVHPGDATLIDETSPAAPTSDYGRSKHLADSMIAASGADAVSLRFAGLWGREGPDHVGLNKALRGVLSGQPPTVIGRGLARRNYLHVSDAAEMILACIEQRPLGVRYAAGSEVLTIEAMLTTLCDVFLPGSKPLRRDGAEASDQIIVPSPDLPPARPFLAALESDP